MKWVIEDNIPIPPSQKGGYRPTSDVSLVMKMMEVGQSVCFGHIPLNSVCGVVTRLKRSWGFVFVTRTTEEGIRVWRTA